MKDAASFAARIREIYRDDLLREAGVVHVMSVWAAPDGCWRCIHIGSSSPVSATDAFVLDVARARADAIVTTGAILRAEPRLRHGLGPAATAWRAECLGKPRPPTSVVLTRRADLDLTHPLFGGNAGRVSGREVPGRTLVVTAPSTARALELRVRASSTPVYVEVMERDVTGLRDVVAWLASERACETILVESGLRASRALYEPPISVDELMLSIYGGPTLEPDARGEIFLEKNAPLRVSLEEGPGTAQEFAIGEASGPWRFQRHSLG